MGLREPAEAYAGNFGGQIGAIRAQDTFLWDENIDDAIP